MRLELLHEEFILDMQNHIKASVTVYETQWFVHCVKRQIYQTAEQYNTQSNATNSYSKALRIRRKYRVANAIRLKNSISCEMQIS